MAYNTPPTKNTGDTWCADDHNTYIRDNFAASAPDVFTAKGDMFVATGANAGAKVAAGSNGQFFVADTSQAANVKWASAGVAVAHARYKKGSDQVVATGSTGAIINYETQVYDSDTAVTTGASWKFTVPAAHGGYYLVAASAALESSAAWEVNEQAALDLYKNGALLCRIAQVYAQAAGTYQMFVAGGTVVSLAAADYVDVRLKQDSDSNVTIDANGTNTHVAISLLF